MIYYNRKYVMKRIWLTWRKSKLEIVGVYEFLIKNKAIVKLYGQSSNKYILDLETADGKYGGMLVVGLKEYKNSKIGTVFGKCSLLRHERERDYYIIAKDPAPEYGLREVSRESKIYLFILLLIIIATVLTGVQLSLTMIK